MASKLQKEFQKKKTNWNQKRNGNKGYLKKKFLNLIGQCFQF